MKWELKPTMYVSREETLKLKRVVKERAMVDKLKGRTTYRRFNLIIQIAFESGLRASEILNIRMEDLRLNHPAHLFVRKGKGNKTRYVGISRLLLAEIKEYIEFKKDYGEDCEGSSYLLISSHNKPYTLNGIEKAFKTCCHIAGLPKEYHIHQARHTFGTNLLRSSNGNLRMVQKCLGHSSPNTTAIYADILIEDSLEAMNNMGN